MTTYQIVAATARTFALRNVATGRWKCTDAADAEVTRRLARCYLIVDSLHLV